MTMGKRHKFQLPEYVRSIDQRVAPTLAICVSWCALPDGKAEDQDTDPVRAKRSNTDDQDDRWKGRQTHKCSEPDELRARW